MQKKFIFLTNFLMLIQIIQKVRCNILMKLGTYKELYVLIPTTLTLIE